MPPIHIMGVHEGAASYVGYSRERKSNTAGGQACVKNTGRLVSESYLDRQDRSITLSRGQGVAPETGWRVMIGLIWIGERVGFTGGEKNQTRPHFPFTQQQKKKNITPVQPDEAEWLIWLLRVLYYVSTLPRVA
jgi:hypothetical protein